jgi:hypothetical protein
MIGLLMQPAVDDVARAIDRKDRCVLLVSPAAAANQFGLSTQVPSKPIYMTDGPKRAYDATKVKSELDLDTVSAK